MTTDERLTRIETRLGDLCKVLLDNGQPGTLTKHDNRITALEDWRSGVHGAMKLAAWVTGVVVTLTGVLLAAWVRK